MGSGMRFFRKTDIIIIAAVLVVCVLGWMAYESFFSGKAARAEIYYNSKLVQTIDLIGGEERTFSIPQKPNVVFELDKEGNIRFERSDCPDQICVHAGKLHIVGQSAACLPNGIVIKIVPQKRSEDDIDVISGNLKPDTGNWFYANWKL